MTGCPELEQSPRAGGEWLRPAWEALDAVRTSLGLATIVVCLLWVGAKLERRLQKAQLSVVDPGAGDEVRDGAGG